VISRTYLISEKNALMSARGSLQPSQQSVCSHNNVEVAVTKPMNWNLRFLGLSAKLEVTYVELRRSAMQYVLGKRAGRRTKGRPEGLKARVVSFIAWVSFSLLGVLIACMAVSVIAYLI
jgi:hypothetical protein